VSTFIKEASDKNIQLVWQTGEYYYRNLLEKYGDMQGIKIVSFIERMDYLYSIADVVVSRAGALALSELCVVAKPCILIPSPNVAEDHQTKNATALSNAGAAILIPDNKACEQLGNTVFELLEDDTKCRAMKANLRKMAQPDATKRIAKEIIKLMDKKNG
jgi:UDP-N-acetylglucosamine--N-acetylmuramyl-(pentapeptide) pyrophosphoryl-undecaprenol N-acetylglucosamine transferase